MKIIQIKILFTTLLLSIATLSLPAEAEQTASEQVQEAFRKAVMEGDLDAIEKTLAADANPNLEIRKGWTALLEAVSTGNLKMARLLIAMGANLDLEIKKVKIGDPRVKRKAWTALLEAVSNGNFEMVELLIKMGANPNLENRKDRTPLLEAVSTGNLTMAQLLIVMRANPNLVNRKYRTALLEAVSNGNFEMVRLLIAMKADPNLEIEVKRKHLIQKGYITALPLESKKIKWTALMEAAATNNLEMVRLLIKMGANIREKDYSGRTALKIAKEHKNTAIAELIENEMKKKVIERQKEVAEAILKARDEEEQETPTDIAKLISEFET